MVRPKEISVILSVQFQIMFFEVIEDVPTDIATITGSVVAVTLVLVVVMISILIRKRNRRYFNLIWFSNVNCIYYPNGLWWPINIWMRSSLTLGFFYKALWEKQLSWQKYYNLYVKFSNFLSMPSWQIAVLVFCLSGPKLVALWTEHETPCKFFKLFIL